MADASRRIPTQRMTRSNMFNRTTELAIQWLVFLALNSENRPISPKRGAEALKCSPSYLAKTSNLLVKAGILNSTRGIHGGVLLAKPAEEITLLEIIEASEGLLTASYCSETEQLSGICSFHQAMDELHREIIRVLSSWTLKELTRRPSRRPGPGRNLCKMFFETGDRH